MNAIFRSELTASVEVITPEIAASLLERNTGNRAVRRAVVSQLARDMKRGHWQLSHQGIAIAPDGRLLDGQHRLNAIVEAGIPVRMVVARNVSPEAFAVMDRGKMRTLRDVLQQDPRVLDACAYIARLHGCGTVQAHHAQEVLDYCGSAVASLIEKAGAVAKGRTAAPVKAAATLRFMQGHSDYVLSQWDALVGLKFGAMAPAMQAFYRQIADETRRQPAGGSSLQNDRAARAWIAFDPERRHVSKIQVRDVESVLAEMRAVWRPSWGA